MATYLNGIKTEEDIKIKLDPAMDSPGGFEDDEDDDQGEIEFSKAQLPNNWLVRIPKELFDGVDPLADDDLVSLGDMKVWKMSNGDEKVHLDLKKTLNNFNLIPKEYDFGVQPKPTNAFSFTEKNLPGFKSNKLGLRPDRSKSGERIGSPYKIEKSRPRGPKTIPKHTGYAGTPYRESLATPRETEEWHRIQAEKQRLEEEANAKKPPIDLKEVNALETATRKAFHDDFIVTDGKKKVRPQENKATRVAEDVLLDQLAALFHEYKYWAMASLRQRTNQPEAWLKEVLSKVATRIDSGPLSGHWMLKPDAARIMRMVDETDIVKNDKSFKEEDIAPKIENMDTDMDDGGENDEEEDDIEFEDV